MPRIATVSGRGSEVTRTVMSATTTINAPTTIITVPCFVDDLVMDSLCHCTAVHVRDERHLRPAHIGTYGRVIGSFGRLYGYGHLVARLEPFGFCSRNQGTRREER
jgi:hypothetical protein